MANRDRALAAICDTFVPGDGSSLPSASAMGTPARLRAEVEALGQPALVSELNQLLDAVESPIINLALSGEPVRFSSLDQARREAYLRRWATSPLGLKRRAFQVLKRLTLLYSYGAEDSPYWELAGYRRAELPPQAAPAPLRVREGKPNEVLDADVCVIGSGAGGAVAAAELAAAGKKVIILERAQLCSETDFRGLELAGSASLFLDRGIASTADRSVSLLAGSAVGGGTIVNWSTSLRLPDSIRAEWERLGAADLNEHYDAVEARLDVDTDESDRNGPNSVLERGMRELGLAYRTIPRNVRGCGDCGHCGYGCRRGAKQSTMRTYLADACRDGAEILTGCEAGRIEVAGGRVSGVVAHVAGGELRVKATTIALAGGSLLSPAVLLRSGLGGEHTGRHLALHPVAVVAGEYDEPMLPWSGVPQSVVSEAFNELTPGYGFRIECPPALPGILAASLPWWGSVEHRAEMARGAHSAPFILIARDREGGRVTIDRQGTAATQYRIDPQTGAFLVRAMQEGLRIHRAAGARRVLTLHTPPLIVDAGQDPATVEAEIARRGIYPNRITIFSAHQMASCRMGRDRATSVVNPEGRLWDVAGLYITDASAFPVSSGVNPMLTVMALARHTAQAMV